MKTKELYKVIGRGKAGWHAKTDNVSSSGNTLHGYLCDAQDNALVYDADSADYGQFARLVMSGPMLDTSLSPGEVDKFSTVDKQVVKHMYGGLSGEFINLANKVITDENFSGLDSVALDIYETLLRKVSGIRIGRVKDSEVVWEE